MEGNIPILNEKIQSMRGCTEEAMWPGPKNGCYELKVVQLTASKRTETSVLQPQGMDEEPEGDWKQIDLSKSY